MSSFVGVVPKKIPFRGQLEVDAAMAVKKLQRSCTSKTFFTIAIFLPAFLVFWGLLDRHLNVVPLMILCIVLIFYPILALMERSSEQRAFERETGIYEPIEGYISREEIFLSKKDGDKVIPLSAIYGFRQKRNVVIIRRKGGEDPLILSQFQFQNDGSWERAIEILDEKLERY